MADRQSHNPTAATDDDLAKQFETLLEKVRELEAKVESLPDTILDAIKNG